MVCLSVAQVSNSEPSWSVDIKFCHQLFGTLRVQEVIFILILFYFIDFFTPFLPELLMKSIGLKDKPKVIDLTRKVGTVETLTEARINCSTEEKVGGWIPVKLCTVFI